MPDVGTTRSRHGPHLVPHSRGENPCTRRYCSCRPPWVGTLRLLRRWFPLAAPACPRQDRAAIPAATRGRASSPVCTRIMPQSRPVMIAALPLQPLPQSWPPRPRLAAIRAAPAASGQTCSTRFVHGATIITASRTAALPIRVPLLMPLAAPPVMTPGSSGPPKEMPKPTTGGKPKDEEAASAPIPIPSPLPAVPSVPVAGNGTPY